MKHTPGPWTIGTVTERGRVYNPNTVSADGESVAMVYGIPINVRLDEIDKSGTWNEGLANAHLIAAAPEMLEALKTLVAACAPATIPLESVKAVRQMGKFLDAVAGANKAICKAEEGQ